ncbi:hypothetical protein GCM10011583_12040 [Streptomyces camponoticapitis]|uniref:DUF7426 domain-containing protein n=1 Tax=Streptomyces camponoticapitis TaxID=1616125 RepID=A0ABQ2E3C3_9ACTN|nr:hypothetical protein [Streptomyces camponoticapitis]GGJ82082.1 hypothetical protein GCM10011583_12040 [Streptomyces camponoticapitis]
MAERFEALDDFLDNALELPVTGKDGVERIYRIEDPAADDGLKVERITALAARAFAGGAAPTEDLLDDEEELDLYRLCLGDTCDKLLAEVGWTDFKRVALTAMFWITADLETAKACWKSGGDPNRLAPNRATRRQKPGSTESGAASTTRSRSSTSGTRAGSHRRRGKGGGRG